VSFTEEVKRARSKTTAQRAETSFMNMLQPQDRNVIKAGQYGERITRDNIGAIKADLSGTDLKILLLQDTIVKMVTVLGSILILARKKCL